MIKLTNWKDDDFIFTTVKEHLYTAVVGDIMDQMGYRHQFISPMIKPMSDEMFLVGRAMTVLQADVFEGDSSDSVNPVLNQPFGLMLDALDDLKKNEVYLCTGAASEYALWGELMTTRAAKLGASGAVLNGYVRDSVGILKLKFPTFSFGNFSQDQAPRGKVIDFRCPIEMYGVRIKPGELIIGDRDGVCVVPREIEEGVLSGAYEKALGEKTVQSAIENGMSAKSAFEKYGIM